VPLPAESNKPEPRLEEPLRGLMRRRQMSPRTENVGQRGRRFLVLQEKVNWKMRGPGPRMPLPLGSGSGPWSQPHESLIHLKVLSTTSIIACPAASLSSLDLILKAIHTMAWVASLSLVLVSWV
jgi:hypothetical protein